MRPGSSDIGKSPANASGRTREGGVLRSVSWPYSGIGFPWQVLRGYRLTGRYSSRTKVHNFAWPSIYPNLVFR
ncbi:hypothetical protein CLJ1_4612 [Pseudomonas paraeruginosa]|nr:hypothetical protein CLJ1_4612 [Pseudomonas aeruginosa]